MPDIVQSISQSFSNQLMALNETGLNGTVTCLPVKLGKYKMGCYSLWKSYVTLRMPSRLSIIASWMHRHFYRLEKLDIYLSKLSGAPDSLHSRWKRFHRATWYFRLLSFASTGCHWIHPETMKIHFMRPFMQHAFYLFFGRTSVSSKERLQSSSTTLPLCEASWNAEDWFTEQVYQQSGVPYSGGKRKTRLTIRIRW